MRVALSSVLQLTVGRLLDERYSIYRLVFLVPLLLQLWMATGDDSVDPTIPLRILIRAATERFVMERPSSSWNTSDQVPPIAEPARRDRIPTPLQLVELFEQVGAQARDRSCSHSYASWIRKRVRSSPAGN